jgi:hypothetical protein
MSRRDVLLTITSLLDSSRDVALGGRHRSRVRTGGFKNVSGIVIMAVWLYGTLVFAERRLGYVIMLLGSLLGTVIPLAHMTGARLCGGRIANSSGQSFWVWTMMSLGGTSMFSPPSRRALWSLPWRRQP